MPDMLTRLLALVSLKSDGKPKVRRSSRWAAVRAAHLRKEPRCAACGGAKGLEVHHIIPVHVDPSKELLTDNLLTLCEDDHFTFGHLKSWHSFNKDVSGDCATYLEKIKGRP